MKTKGFIPLLTLFLLVLGIFAWVHGVRLLAPEDFMFYDEYDGLKNYFTLCSYVLGPTTDPAFFITGMNYPYGESIIYTDNTPLIAIFIKYCSWASTPQEVIGLFNMIIIGLLFCGHFVCYRLSRVLGIIPWLSVLTALVIPVMVPMTLKLSGHYNLALPITILLPILFTLNITAFHKSGDHRRSWLNVLYLVTTAIALFFVHVYLFAMAMIFCSIYLGYFCLLEVLRYRSVAYGAKLLVAVITPVIAVVAALYLMDPWLSERPKGHNGYGIADYVVKISDMFTNIDALSIQGLGGTVPWAAEDYSYFGGVFPFAMLIVIASLIFGFRRIKNAVKGNVRFQALFIILLVCFFISLGTNIKTHEDTSGFTNVFNVFSLLTMVSDTFMNFRCVNRFIWLSWILFHLLFIRYVCSSLFRDLFNRFYYVIIAIVAMLYVVDASQLYQYHSIDFQRNNKFSDSSLGIWSNEYGEGHQSILPIPYFCVGSESEFKYTMDANNGWGTVSMQIALESDLPMMSGLLSRTPIRVTKNLQSIFNSTPLDDLLGQMNEEPVLIIKDLNFFYPPIAEPKMQLLRDQTLLFIEDNMHRIQVLDTIDHVVFYSLNIGSRVSE